MFLITGYSVYIFKINVGDKLETTNNSIAIAGFRFNHMTEESGYQQIAKYINADYIDANNMKSSLGTSGTFKFRVNMLFFEYKLMSLAQKYNLIHFLYPEKHMCFCIPRYNNFSTKYIATMHLPFIKESNMSLRKDLKANLKAIWRKRQLVLLKRCDGIIVLSSQEEKYVRKYFPKVKVRFIPHGINVSLYRKEEVIFHKNNLLNIVVIGKNFRDDDMIIKVIKYGSEKKWRFHLIGSSKYLKIEAKKYSNVIIYPHISTREYVELLAEMDVHFLAVTYASANNALLEASSAGIISVCSDIGGIHDYAVSTTKFYKNLDEAIKLVEDVATMDKCYYCKQRDTTLKEVKKFAWDNVAKETEIFYNDVLETNN